MKSVVVEGAVTNGYRIVKRQVMVRFTSDEIGETLSLDDQMGMMIMVPFEQVDKLIKQTRRKK